MEFRRPIVMLGLIALLAALLGAGAAITPSALWAWLTLPLAMGATLLLARTMPRASILLAPLLLLRASELVSLALIESGATMTETMTLGRPSGAACHLLLLSLATIAPAAMLIERMLIAASPAAALTRWPADCRRLTLALTAILAAATLTLAILGLTHGVPLIGHIDRFTYLNRLAGTPFASLIRNGALLGPFIGVLLAVPSARRAGLLLLGWLLLLSILFGEKFTSLLLILGSAAVPPALTSSRSFRPLLLGALGLAALSLPAILITYGALASPHAALARFADRATVQGQLFYLADRLPPPLTIDMPALAADVASWPRPADQHPAAARTRFGLYYVMARFTPSHSLERARASTGGFVFPLYAYLRMTGGPLLMIPGALALLLAQGAALALLARAILAARWLAALAFARLVASCYATLTTGYLWNLLGVKTLVTLAIGVFLLRVVPRKITVTPVFANASRAAT